MTDLRASNASITSPLTAFGEVLMAEMSPIFQYSFEYTVDNTDLTINTEVAGGTVTQANAMAIVTTSTTTGSTAMMQTYSHAKYRAGQGGCAMFTALFETAGVAGTVQLVGLGDEPGATEAVNNGYLIGYVGTVFGVHRYSNDVLNTVALADCDDPLDGSGASKMTIDTTKLNVFKIQFQYLGAGAIEYFVEDDATGKFVKFHTELYANKNTTPSVHNPNFHMGILVDNGATTSNLVLKSGSMGYFIQGKTEFIQVHQPHNSTGTVTKNSVTSEVAIFTIRNKTTYAGKNNFIEILLQNFYASIEAGATNNLGEVRLVKNATLGGTPVYSDIDTNNSVIELDTAGTTVTGGVSLPAVPLAGKNDKANTNATSLGIMLKEGETLTLAGSSANAATIKGGGFWRELF